MNIYTDMADELFRPGKGTVPPGVQVRTASSGPIRLTRVQITRQGLARPAGRYSTLETPSLAALDKRDERLISAAATELRVMLPATGLVLVVGRVTALSQVMGYLVAENGIFLLGIPLMSAGAIWFELTLLLDIFVAVFVMGIAINHINDTFESIDVNRFHNLRD